MSKIIIFYSLFITLFFCKLPAVGYAEKNYHISQILKKISSDDQKLLTDFFQELITQQSFGYVLCGNKPISIAEMAPDLPDQDVKFIPYFSPISSKALLRVGWQTWNKYFDQNKNKKFIMSSMAREGLQLLVLINQETCLTVIEKNLDLFEKFFKERKSAQEWLLEINNLKSLEKIFNSSEAISGILLGYGRTNSLAFEKRSQLVCAFKKMQQWPLQCSYSSFEQLEESDRELIQSLRWDKKKINSYPCTFKNEKVVSTWKFLKNKLEPRPGERYEFEDINFTRPVGFIVFNDIHSAEENEKLLLEYHKAKKTIVEKFKGKSFFEEFLALFIGL